MGRDGGYGKGTYDEYNAARSAKMGTQRRPTPHSSSSLPMQISAFMARYPRLIVGPSTRKIIGH